MVPKSILRILIPTDFSETAQLAINHGAFMAKLNKAELILLHAVEVPFTLEFFNPDTFSHSLELRNSSMEQLEKIANIVRKKYCIEVKIKCVEGSVSAEIRNVVETEKIDIVVMGTHGASGFRELFIGSNAQNTVKACPCPVITIQSETENTGFRKIILPIDDNFESRQKVNFIIRFAKMYAAKVYILGLLAADESDDSRFRVKIHSVEKTLLAAGVLFESRILRSKNFAASVLKYASKTGADLISTLTGHESRFTNSFVPAFAGQIVNHSKIPVLSIRPMELGIYDSVSLSGSNGAFI